MKPKNKRERTECWWMMVHALDIIKFTMSENFQGQDYEDARNAYYTLIRLSNKYHE